MTEHTRRTVLRTTGAAAATAAAAAAQPPLARRPQDRPWQPRPPNRPASRAIKRDGTDAEFMSLLNALQPDEAMTVLYEEGRVHADTWGRVPHTYIRHTLDRMLPIALQDRMIREADALTPWNRFDIQTVEASHAATLATYAEIIRILDSLAR